MSQKSEPKKTWTEEQEPKMPKPTGEASPSGVEDGSSHGFPVSESLESREERSDHVHFMEEKHEAQRC